MGRAKGKSRALQGQGNHKGGSSEELSATNQELLAQATLVWATLSRKERENLLTIKVDDLYDRAFDEDNKKACGPHEDISPGLTLERDLDTAISCYFDEIPLKEWRWPDASDDEGHSDVDLFWEFLEEEYLDAHLAVCLPRNEYDYNTEASRAEDRLGDYMSALYTKTCDLHQKLRRQEQALKEQKGTRIPGDLRMAIRNRHIELIMMVLKDLHASPYRFLYRFVQYEMHKVVSASRPSTHFSVSTGYEMLQELQDDVLLRLTDWLKDKIDMFFQSAKGTQEADEDVDDMAFLSLVDDDASTKFGDHEIITVDPDWLLHLKDWPNDENSGSDESSGLLQWIFGFLIGNLTARRKAAKKAPGTVPYTTEHAFDALHDTLKIQEGTTATRDQARFLAKDLLQNRKDLPYFLSKCPDMYITSEFENEDRRVITELPDDVVLFMLSRELNLATAKIIIESAASAKASIEYDAFRGKMQEVEFTLSKLKSEKARSLYYDPDEGYFGPEEKLHDRKAARKVEEEIKVNLLAQKINAQMTALQEDADNSTPITEQSQQEFKLLLGWADWLQKAHDNFKLIFDIKEGKGKPNDKKAGKKAKKGSNAVFPPELPKLPSSDAIEPESEPAATTVESDVLEGDQNLVPATPHATLSKAQTQWLAEFSDQFYKTVRPRLFTEQDDKELLAGLSKQVKDLDVIVADGWASLKLLEKNVEDVACEDLEDRIATHLFLPILRERIHDKYQKMNESRAKKANLDLISEEDERIRKERQKQAKKMKKKRAKQKKADARVAAEAAGQEIQSEEEGLEDEVNLAVEQPASLTVRQDDEQPQEGKVHNEEDSSWNLIDSAGKARADRASGTISNSLELQDAVGTVHEDNHGIIQAQEPSFAQGEAAVGGGTCPSKEEFVSDDEAHESASFFWPMQMPPSQLIVKKPARPKPPVELC